MLREAQPGQGVGRGALTCTRPHPLHPMPRAPRAAAQPAAQPAAPAAPAPQPTVEELAALYLRAQAELKNWEAYKKSITAQMSALHSAGKLPTKFNAAGYGFTLQDGKRSMKLDTIGKGHVANLQAQLLKDGHATETFGDPFWVAREIKAPKNQESLADEDYQVP